MYYLFYQNVAKSTDSLNQSCDEYDFRKQLDTYKKINRKVFFRIGTKVIVSLFFINFSAYSSWYKISNRKDYYGRKKNLGCIYK